jgi:hypothetical protein
VYSCERDGRTDKVAYDETVRVNHATANYTAGSTQCVGAGTCHQEKLRSSSNLGGGHVSVSTGGKQSKLRAS